MWWFWLIASGVFFIIEIFTVGFLIFWLGIAAIVAMIASFITENVAIQTAVFVIACAILIPCTRKLSEKIASKTQRMPTNVYRLIGKEGIVLEDINSLSYTGKIKVSGQIWSAISDTDISKNTIVKVLSIEGVKLKVEKCNKTVTQK